MANFSENSDKIRQSHLDEGYASLRSRIKDVRVEHVAQPVEKQTVEPKYTKEETADRIVQMYKDEVKPVRDTPYNEQLPTHDPIDRSKEKEEANTIAKRANIRALSNSLASIRNGGYAGPTTEFTPSANGDVNPGRPRGYNALVVAGTEMTLEQYEEYIASKFDECWKGYKRKPGTVKGAKGSCVKEEEQIDEVTYPSDFVKGSGVAKKKYGRPQQHDQPVKGPMTSPVRKTIDEERYKKARPINAYPASLRAKTMGMSSADRDAQFQKYDAANPFTKKIESVVDDLKDALLEMDDHSWQSIDTVMRKLAKENDMTPKELHKQFKTEHNGQIPDDWAKENALKEEAGWMPLDEAVMLNRMGNVYEVSLMWRAHTRRLKFFWPEAGDASQQDMQRAVDMFYPGGRLLSFYKSLEPGDNQTNFMVIVPPLRESVWLPENAWEEMDDELCAKYEMIIAEEGEPTSPPLQHEDGRVELWIMDHDTGEEKQVFFEKDGKKDACYKKVKSRYSVWPSAYASGALVKCRQKGAANWGNSSKKEEVEYVTEDDMKGMSVSSGDKRSTESGAGLTAKGVAKYRAKNPGSKLKTAVTTPPSKLKPGSKAAGRRKSFCARSRGWTGERGKAARRRWNC